MAKLKRVAWIVGSILIATLTLSALAGSMIGPGILHPQRRPLSDEITARVDQRFAAIGARHEDLAVTAPDGIVLRGWKVYPARPNGDWVVLLHGVGDNRFGTYGQAELLLQHGYGVLMVDVRGHGASGGEIVTYGWQERNDSKAIDDALISSDNVAHLFYLGESMGAAIALQSAGVDSRIGGVVAEAPFQNLREVTYDYAGFQSFVFLGKTLFRPATITALRVAEKQGGFEADDVSPEVAVANHAFPVLLICDAEDRKIPCRHAEAIYNAAIGPKELWVVPRAGHSMALGTDPGGFARRVLSFLAQSAAMQEPLQ